jgi:hypothetical protein
MVQDGADNSEQDVKGVDNSEHDVKSADISEQDVNGADNSECMGFISDIFSFIYLLDSTSRYILFSHPFYFCKYNFPL